MPFNGLKFSQEPRPLVQQSTGGIAIYSGKLIFSQVMEHLPLHVFYQCIERYNGNFKVKDFTCLDHYKLHEVNTLDLVPLKPGAFYVMDRGYLDFQRLYPFHHFRAFFVIRAKSNLKFRRVYSGPTDRSMGIMCDQTILLTGVKSAKHYPEKASHYTILQVLNVTVSERVPLLQVLAESYYENETDVIDNQLILFS